MTMYEFIDSVILLFTLVPLSLVGLAILNSLGTNNTSYTLANTKRVILILVVGIALEITIRVFGYFYSYLFHTSYQIFLAGVTWQLLIAKAIRMVGALNFYALFIKTRP